MDNNTIDDIDKAILSKLKDTKEQKIVVGPMVKHLVSTGWALDQIMFGREEWLVPKTPSEQTKREQGRKYAGFPVDITVFDDPNHLGDWRHVLFLIECKQPTIEAGLSQLESYFVGEPHARLGVWANNPDSAAPAAFVYRRKNGSMQVLRKSVHSIPRPGEVIQPDAHRMTLNDLIPPSADVFQKTISDILDKVVIEDPNVTRREEQLDQICNILLLKLESDKQAKANPDEPVFFQPMESPNRTAKAIRERYTRFVQLYPDTFTTEQDKTLKFSDDTLASCVDLLCGLRIIDLGLSTVSLAFQVLRSEALKQNEGQYFTPHAVIEAGVRLMQIQWDDIIIDPACGTGGFLVECLTELKRRYSNITPTELSRWAQTHIHGIEKDAIGLKLTKAIMQIAGDGSAHCARGDSVRIHKWSTDFPHLAGSFNNGRFTVVITNPPFGENLKVSANDSRLSRLEIAKDGNKHYQDLEIGLLFLQRAYDLLDVGGRVGIVLPETYFFSPTYKFVQEWMKSRFKPKVVLNVPMEAFQGFCRAKTNFYVFEKIKVEENKE